MDKIDVFKPLDEKKLSKLAKERNDWLNSGNDMLINTETHLSKLVKKMYPNEIAVLVKAVVSENDNFKSIVICTKNGEALPKFRAGQKIAVTIFIDDKNYTSPFSLSGNPVRAANGEYRILVKKSEDDFVSNYLFCEGKKDMEFTVSCPFGEFYYNSLRDEKNVIAIVSDTGIAPIMAMVQAIISGVENFKLILFYSEKYESDILFKEELMEYAESSDMIDVYFVLSADVKDGMMSGFVSLDKIKNVMLLNKTSFFISGGEGLLKYLDNELKDLKLPKKFIRYDSFLPRCNIKKAKKYILTIYIDGRKLEVPCYNNKTIMKSLFEAGISIPSKCGNGTCGLCTSELVLGEVKIVNDKRVKADKKFNYIHPCSTYPLSDICIIVR